MEVYMEMSLEYMHACRLYYAGDAAAAPAPRSGLLLRTAISLTDLNDNFVFVPRDGNLCVVRVCVVLGMRAAVAVAVAVGREIMSTTMTV